MKFLRSLVWVWGALLLPQAGFGAYQYYVTDNLQNSSTSAQFWRTNGETPSQDANGLATWNSTALISTVAVPDGSSHYEVAAKIHLNNDGGYYTLYLNASPDAVLDNNQITGTFYAFTVGDIQINNGVCSATVWLDRVVNGNDTTVGSNTVPCGDGMVYHAVSDSIDGLLRFYVNGVQPLYYADAQPLPSGAAGIGAACLWGGDSITLAEVGLADHVAPNVVNNGAVQQFATPNRVDLRTSGVQDDSNGIGVLAYFWYKDGVAVSTSEQPEWSDVSVHAGETHSYGIAAQDFHGNIASYSAFPVTVPSGPALDPRQVGRRTTGTYWGALGEQIDVRSGNLNYTAPLLTLQGRGWTVPLGLAYNSQNWWADHQNRAWKAGDDVGYGFGWQLQAGSLTPFYSRYWFVHHYEFRDGSGAQYRLDQNNNGVWTAKDSSYVTYDANRQRLYFNNGTFWVFGCTSAGAEQDTGTMYPTLLEDANGNQISLSYAVGQNASLPNSSARLAQITDTRPVSSGATYTFTYNSDAVPHLTGISNQIQSGESYSFTYGAAVTLSDPITNSSGTWGSAQMLNSVTNQNTTLSTAFTYDPANTGELNKVTLPFNGYLRWAYQTSGYANSSVREVANRYLYWDATLGERNYQFAVTSGTNNYLPSKRTLTDATAQAGKEWDFVQTQDSTLGLLSEYKESSTGTSATVLRDTTYTWAQDSVGNNYVSRLKATSDPGQSSAQTKQIDQTLDSYGNATQTKLYSYTDLTHPARTYNRTFLTTQNSTDYTALYIRNRLAQNTVTDGTNTVTLTKNTFDQYSTPLTATGGITMQDSSMGTAYTTRGNLTAQAVPGMNWTSNYDQTGLAVWIGKTNYQNHYVSQASSSATNYTAPDWQMTADSLQTNLTWSPFLGLSGQTGWNGEATGMQYDSAARPQTRTSPYGATTTYTYSTTAPQVTATVNNRWTKTYLDGLGRPTRVERGTGVTTVSVVETTYESCGCSPAGKLKQTSTPHAAGVSAAWTTYTYDALGRTSRVVRPDGASSYTFSYAGNAVTQTDPAGKWKKFVTDALGNLVEVDEPSPNPASEPNHVTLYTYDLLNHLTKVQMDRTVGGQVRTQFRTWTYDPTTQWLTGKTTPEAGTVNYTYNADGTLATVTDANNHRRVFTYDNYGRVTQVARGSVAGTTFTEDVSQRTNFTYSGTNGGYSTNTTGRVSLATYTGPHGLAVSELYSYLAAGDIQRKKLVLSGTPFGSATPALEAAYSFDNEGHVSAVQYPVAQWNANNTTTAGPAYAYSYEALGRLNTMTDQANNSLVGSVSYTPADQIAQLTASTFTETRSYNANLELTELVSGANVHLKYTYSATQNNGQIASQMDVLSGETISYQYDTLQRLTQASATGDSHGAWSDTYGYDGFGNLTQKTASNAPGLNIAVDPATNRLQTSASYDNNGNMTGYSGSTYAYDIENRMVQANPSTGGTVLYGYDSTNQRVYKGALSGTIYSAEEIYFYGADGRKYGTWQVNPTSGVLLQASVTKQWFGARLLSPQDRLDSRGKYYPYGEERTNVSPANPPNDQEKFASYTRDSATGLDYANQRYYNSLIGRFMQPDRFGGSARRAIPQSWNRYAYVGNDPLNAVDPLGLDNCFVPPDSGQPVCYSDAPTTWTGGDGADFSVTAFSFPTPTPAPPSPAEQFQNFISGTFNSIGSNLTNGFSTLVTAGTPAEAGQGALQLGLGYAQLAPVAFGAAAPAAEAGLLFEEGSTAAAQAANSAQAAAESAQRVQSAAQNILDALGPDPVVLENTNSDLGVSNSDGTLQFRFDLTDPHGLDPHMNIDTFTPRNAFPGDTRMIQVKTPYDHVFFNGN